MSFPVMDYKYRSLLLNVPTRHLLNRMKEGDQAIMDHLKLMDRIDLVNGNCPKIIIGSCIWRLIFLLKTTCFIKKLLY